MPHTLRKVEKSKINKEWTLLISGEFTLRLQSTEEVIGSVWGFSDE